MAALRVLVVEDDDELRAMWKETLEAAGYSCVAFSGAADALQQLSGLAPALIILDMTLPGMDGFEFLARVRGNPTTTHIPMLIVSGLGHALSTAIDAQSAKALRLAGILGKPVRPAELLAWAERVVGPAGTREPP